MSYVPRMFKHLFYVWYLTIGIVSNECGMTGYTSRSKHVLFSPTTYTFQS